jgi:putative DNA primase/helicase
MNATATAPVELVLSKLPDARPAGEGRWSARCPAHDDAHASLSIGLGDDGKVLLCCHARCALPDILRAIGISERDLFPPKPTPPARPRSPRAPHIYPAAEAGAEAIGRRVKGRLVGSWPYHGSDGAEVLRVLRFALPGDKTYRPIHPVCGGWAEGDPPGPLPVYGLPSLNGAGTIFAVEGEKCADAARSIGLCATTSAHGAGSAHKTDWAPLAGRDVVILPDADDGGEGYASDVAAILTGLNPPAKVKIVRLPQLPEGSGADIADWVEARDGIEPDALRAEVLHLAEAAPLWTPAATVATSRGESGFENAIHLTDLGNARRFAREHGENVRHVPAWRTWLVWTGQRWLRDESGEVNRLAARTVAGIYREGADTSDRDAREKLIKHALKSESAAALKNMLAMAESLGGIPVLPSALDADPWLLNALNGTVDLRMGELRPQRRDDLITKLAPVPYDPTARSELWESVLSRTQRGDAERVAFLQRAFGSALAGCNPDDRLYFVNGPKGSGKTTVIEAIGATLGDYGKTASFESFLAKRESGSHTAGLVPLVGARYVWASETDAGRAKRFAEGVLNLMSGGDTMRMRDLYEKSFQTKVTWKVFLAANARPRLTDDERDGIWRRMTLIEFPDEIPKAEVQLAVRPTLTDPAQSGAAILAWLVAGCLDWRARGLRVPESIEAATEAYRLEQDPLQPFLEECCVVRDGATVSAAGLWAAWESYAGKGAMSRASFGRRLARRGFVKNRTGGSRTLVYHGLELLP